MTEIFKKMHILLKVWQICDTLFKILYKSLQKYQLKHFKAPKIDFLAIKIKTRKKNYQKNESRYQFVISSWRYENI